MSQYLGGVAALATRLKRLTGRQSLITFHFSTPSPLPRFRESGLHWLSIFTFCAWNSSAVKMPRSRSAASLFEREVCRMPPVDDHSGMETVLWPGPRLLWRTARPRVRLSSKPVKMLDSTVLISNRANAMPMQRRTPPPNGKNSKEE
jgi:hypothetical protein